MIKERVVRAYVFAQECHKGQIRKFSSLPYFVHPKAVARTISDLKKDEDMIIASLLHDVIEDCEVSLDTIEHMFGKEVASLVEELTIPKDKRPKLERLLGKIEKMSPKALTIKLADRLNNIGYCNKDNKTLEQKHFVKKYYIETKKMVEFIEVMELTPVQELLLNMIRNELKYLQFKHLWD